ncbi:transcription factor GTE9 isoform X1 [Vitis vinifera]|uniref:transcription factor GTE9 isoform X1 n=1 Tax=Vitis vinifera TaxID=29760 RepID=UPI000540274A|nr:transcription factor GTE9 isoform X1 [Vitis vinifera]XP_010655606.1 transcription factor GTE9 isoform X1 [Vitis vinifera]XP_010655607.1 transcription factor GTE9 isoform X1 [Vitis vinifera]|eukprot:XP_010655605.1 PREDICTED: transcription factor GTE9 isoform X1 [Vitis vinifera]
MDAIGKILPNRKLKIKFAAKKVEAEPVTLSCEFGNDISLTDESVHEAKSSIAGTKKRGTPGITDVPKAKRQKMDRSTTLQCTSILKKLMTHPAGWVFNQPVDPVALNIPDYFSIISKPMDLGTIKSKLEKNMYLATEEFAADVRLTFANAMLYNPPSNNVHQMAKKLNDLFNTRWKTVDTNWSESSKVDPGKILSGGRGKTINSSRQKCSTTPSLHANSMSFEDKQKLRKELMEVSRGKMPPYLGGFLRRHGMTCQNIETMEVNIDKFDEETLLELRRVMKISCDARTEKVECTKTAENCRTKSSGKDLDKGTDRNNAHACGSGNTKLPLSLQNDSNNGSSSDLSTERSFVKDYRACSSDASEPNCQVKNTISRISKSDPDSDGAVSAVDDENICTSSHPMTPTTAAAPGEGWITPIFDVQLSPKKALRAAMLKSRFADTILKAQQKTLLDHGNKADRVKMQQKKERLEKKQLEEKGRLEAQVRAAEAASRMKAETESKLQREKEREAARVALQKMARTVEFENNVQIVKELEKLSGCVLTYQYYRQRDSKVQLRAFNFGNPLERLGLYIKDDFFVDEDEKIILNEDGEEGEILY